MMLSKKSGWATHNHRLDRDLGTATRHSAPRPERSSSCAPLRAGFEGPVFAGISGDSILFLASDRAGPGERIKLETE